MNTFELGAPDQVTVGAIGPVGARLFLLQAREGSTMVTIKVEKQQVVALSHYLGRLLTEIPRPGDPPEAPDLQPIDEPDFVAGSVAVAYDEDVDRVIMVVEEFDDDESDDGASARVAMTREQAAALAIRGVLLAEAGRPPCPLCGFPLDARGHACPRTNGHRAPLT